MSKPAPQAQKGNFFQTLLIMLLIWFVIFKLFPNNQNQNQQQNSQFGPLVTRQDYLRALQKCDAQLLEATGTRIDGEYNGLIDQDVKKNVITRQEGDAEKIQGAVLVADAFYKAGLKTDDSNKIRTAYGTLQGYKRRMSDSTAWSQAVVVTNPDNKTTRQVTGQQLFDQVVETLKQRNRTDLVYGFIPGGWAFIDALVHLTGAVPSFSYAFAGFLLALTVRALVFPLAQKQFMFSRQMSQLMPRVKEIKDRYPDQVTQNQKTMELYREYGINPFAGCWPAFIQAPLFLTVYQCMLHYQFQFQNGTFLWINPATSLATHGFVAANLGEQDTILIVIYGITMLVSTLLTPITVADRAQRMQQRLISVGMSVVITVFMFFGFFPVVSGFVLYWTFTNLLSTAQAIRAYRLPMPPLVKVNAAGGGVYPTKPKGRWAQMIDDMQQRMLEEQSRTREPQAKAIEETPKPAPEEKPAPADGQKRKPKSSFKPSSNGKPSNGQLKKDPSSKPRK